MIRGRNLYQTDLFSKIDPFVQVKFGDDISTSITQRDAGQNVDFNWSVSFPFDAKADDPALELTAMDSNTLRPDDTVGHCKFTHKELAEYREEARAYDGEVQLTRHGLLEGLLGSDKAAGFLQVRIFWQKQKESFPVPSLRCVSNKNVAGGIVRELLDGGKFEIFRTFQLNLWMVGAVFQGETCGWNQSYKAAKMIYGNDPKAMIIRQGIKVQHCLLYSKDKGVGSYREHEIRGLLEFYQMLTNGPSHSGTLSTEASSPSSSSSPSPSSSPKNVAGRRYTYVILPDSTMHFSRTGKATAQDFLSKHALHSCARRSVVYAGEFFFDTKINPKPTLIIDNNSGTFAPAKDKLPLLQTLLELNFGSDFPIITLDRDDPELQMYFEANEIQ